jgi:hypothetical protein
MIFHAVKEAHMQLRDTNLNMQELCQSFAFCRSSKC